MMGRGIGMLWLFRLGTKGVDEADRAGWVVTGTGGRVGEGLATDRLLNTADTSPNSNSGEVFLGVFHTTPPDPGKGTAAEGWTMVDRLTFSWTLRALSLRSRNS